MNASNTRRTRRQLVVCLGLAAAMLGHAPLLFAQRGGKVWRIGYLTPGRQTSASPGPATVARGFFDGLRALGYVEGRDYILIRARGSRSRWQRLCSQSRPARWKDHGSDGVRCTDRCKAPGNSDERGAGRCAAGVPVNPDNPAVMRTVSLQRVTFFSYTDYRASASATATTFVDKILKGAKPGDLPFEEPTEFELVVNLRIAKALGLTIPDAVMLQATRVIQ